VAQEQWNRGNGRVKRLREWTREFLWVGVTGAQTRLSYQAPTFPRREHYYFALLSGTKGADVVLSRR